MDCKWIIGASDYLDMAHDAWCRAFPSLSVEKVVLAQDASYAFDLGPLDTIDSAASSAFVAFDERFGNFKRSELMQLVMERGFKLASFVSPRSMLGGDVQVGPNVFIGDGAIVGHGSRIDYNSVLLPGVQVGSKTHVHSSCWLEMGASVGNGASVGAHCTIRTGAQVGAGVRVGRGCELGWPQRYDSEIAANTIFDHRYDEPILTFGR